MEFIPVPAEDAKAPTPDPVVDSVVDSVPNIVLKPNTTIFTLMHKLEQDALDKVLSIHKTVETKKTEKPSDLGDLLMQIMEQGAQEFKQTTGRNMTYSEMRSMYG